MTLDHGIAKLIHQTNERSFKLPIVNIMDVRFSQMSLSHLGVNPRSSSGIGSLLFVLAPPGNETAEILFESFGTLTLGLVRSCPQLAGFSCLFQNFLERSAEIKGLASSALLGCAFDILFDRFIRGHAELVAVFQNSSLGSVGYQFIFAICTLNTIRNVRELAFRYAVVYAPKLLFDTYLYQKIGARGRLVLSMDASSL